VGHLHTIHCQPPIQFTASLPYNSLPASHTNHCQPPVQIHCQPPIQIHCQPPIQITASLPYKFTDRVRTNDQVAHTDPSTLLLVRIAHTIHHTIHCQLPIQITASLPYKFTASPPYKFTASLPYKSLQRLLVVLPQAPPPRAEHRGAGLSGTRAARWFIWEGGSGSRGESAAVTVVDWLSVTQSFAWAPPLVEGGSDLYGEVTVYVRRRTSRRSSAPPSAHHRRLQVQCHLRGCRQVICMQLRSVVCVCRTSERT